MKTSFLSRAIQFTPHINPYALGSVLVEFGNTKVHVTVNLEEKVPPFLEGTTQGWLSAEYSMLPGSTHTRTKRERTGISGRSQEIQRLIARTLRASLDLSLISGKTFLVDCDVLVADGGTRTASLTGASLALGLAFKRLLQDKKISQNPQRTLIAGLSIGISATGAFLVDMNYAEDSSCAVDFNVVMTEHGELVELQGAAEKGTFSIASVPLLLEKAHTVMKPIFELQRTYL